MVPSRFMNKNFGRIKDLNEKSPWLSAIRRIRRRHHPKNKSLEVHPKLLKLMMILRKTLIEISSPLFQERSTKYGEEKVSPSGKIH